ncbi:MAG: hypothetical protein NZ576_05620, partial [Bacteroidia bacterium]|nr:hypothetical protein [Bacteroidia bacterium]
MIGTRTLSLVVQNPGPTACTSPVTTQVVEVIDVPSPPIPQVLLPPSVHGVVCIPNPGQAPGASTVLSALTGQNGDQVRWYSAPVGGTHFHVGNQYNTPVITTHTTYYLTTFNTVTGCESTPRVPIVVEAHPIPSPPTAQNQSRCGFGVLTMTATPGSNGSVVRWYDVPVGGQPRNAGPNGLTFTTDTLFSNKTYYISTLNPNTTCEGPRVPITAIIHPIPGVPQSSGLEYCYNSGGNLVTFTVLTGQPSGDEVRLYTQAIGGNAVDISSQQVPFTLVHTIQHNSVVTSTQVHTYYISSRVIATGCESQRLPVLVKIHPRPAIPLSTNERRCGPGPVTFLLNMGHPAGNEAYLYSVPTGGVALDVTNSNDNPPNYQLTTPILSAAPPYYPYSRRDTFYVEARDNKTGCTSAGRNMYIATVLAVPHPPTVSDMKRCGGGSLTFTLTQVAPPGTVEGNSIRIYSSAQTAVAVALLQSPPYVYSTPVLTSTTTFYAESVIDSTLCPSARVPFVAEVIPPLNPPVSANVSRCGFGSVVFTVQTGFSTPGLVQARLYNLPAGGSVLAADDLPPYELQSPAVATTTTFYIESYMVGANCPSSVRVPVIAVVHRPPDTAVVLSARRCGPGVVGFYPKFGSQNGDEFRLYTVPIGGTYIEKDNLSPYFLETNYITTTSTFYVEVYNSVTGCVSLGRRMVEAIIDELPGVPIASDTFRCGPGSLVINAHVGTPAGAELRLYDALSGGNLLQVVSSAPYDFTLPYVSTHTTYFIESVHSNGCKSNRIPVKAEIKQQVGLPIVQDVKVCGSTGNNTVLYASMGIPAGIGLGLYDSELGGNLLLADMSSPYEFLIPSINVTTTFYVGALSAVGCEAPRKAVVVEVLPIPSAPEVAEVSRCGAGEVIFTAQIIGTVGNAVRLYTVSNGGVVIRESASGPTYELRSGMITTNSTFYVEAVNTETGCVSERVAAEAVIHTLPLAPKVKDLQVCGGGEVTFTVELIGGAGKVKMYTQAVGGVPTKVLDVAPYFFSSGVVSTSTMFYFAVEDEQTGCESARVGAKLKVVSAPSEPLAINGSRCGAGVVRLRGLMGSVAGDEILLYGQSSGGTVLSSSGVFPYELVTMPLGATTTFYISARDNETGCESSRVPVVAVIHNLPGVSVGADVSRCGRGKVRLSVLVGNPTPTAVRLYNQSVGGAVLGIDKNYPFEFQIEDVATTTTYYVESYDENTGCISSRSAIVVSILERPAAPIVNSSRRCGLGSFTFTAFPGNLSDVVVNLYTLAEGGTPLSTTNLPPYELVVGPVSTTTTFFVSVVDSKTGCESERVAVVGQIDVIPGLPQSGPVTRCGAGVAY